MNEWCFFLDKCFSTLNGFEAEFSEFTGLAEFYN